ncbi:MAG TPA: VTT domain-containing protein [Vicinamibacterales bacterium]
MSERGCVSLCSAFPLHTAMSTPARPARARFKGWAILVALLLGLILAPFVMFEDAMFDMSMRALAPDRSRSLTGIAVVALLASDIFLPVPSSLVSTAAGTLLGFFWGTVASAVGMTLGCSGGYLLGHRYGRPAAAAVVAPDDIARAEATLQAHGVLSLVLFRPVPVLAEASVISAGTLRLPFAHVFVAVSAANVVVSAWYAGMGASAPKAGFVLVFAGALALPALALLIRAMFRRSVSAPEHGGTPDNTR